MESTLLNALGIPSFDPGYLVIALLILLIVLISLIIALCVQKKTVKQLTYRLDRLCAGKDGESLEEELGDLFEDNHYLMTTVAEHKTSIKNLYKRMEKAYQKRALVKYDAFHQMGGQLSFVLVMLDEDDNGYLINSVHTADSSYCYAKEIENGSCRIDLGEEEAQALEQAKSVVLPMLR